MASTIEPASDGGGGDYIFRYTMTQGSDATRGFLGGLGPYVVGIKIDDVEVPVGTTQYFFAAGDHTVELTLSEGTIPDNCFVLWSEIKGIELVGEFKYIGERAFVACSGLTRISMDCQTLETVGPSAFAQIWNIVSFNNEADAVLDFASVSSLGGGSLTGIAIGNATVKFGDMLTSFGNSSGYQGAAISERRPNGGFDIEFGTGLATIYGGAIDRCWIRNIVCKATTPPTFVPTSQTSIIFQGQLLGNIKVPAASVAAYKTAPGWSEYASMICPLWEGDISLNHLSLGDFRRRIMMGISLPSSSIIVPSGYTQCDWIAPEVGATPYIRLGEIKNQQVRAFEVGVTMTGQATTDDWQVILGGCTNYTISFSLWINNSWGTLGGGAAESPNDRYYYYTIGERLTIKAENDLLYVNNNSVGTYRLSVPDPNWQYVCLFSRWTNGSPSSQYFAGRIHYAKFYDTNGDLLWDGVACRRDSDNKFGFYDSVSQGFFGKEGGNGEFTGQLL